MNYGTLCDYQTGASIRPATPAEWQASLEAEASNVGGGTGVILVDGQSVYVEGGDDLPTSDSAVDITATNMQTGETIAVTRDVCATHPAWLHAQCETESEAELQEYLSQCDVSYFYRADGTHRGPDIAGISLFRR